MAWQHLESLRAVGVEWVEAAAPVDDPPVAADPEPEPAAEPARPRSVAPALSLVVRAPAGDELSPAEKRKALQVLDETQVVGCQKCAVLVQNRTQTVFGVGDPNAELMFVGEAPGADEDRQGEPFVGAAGQLLTRILKACGLTREQVFIANVLKCRPPGNRTPLPDEIANCFPNLERQIDIIRPKFICCLGAVAAQALLGTTLGISKLRGRFHAFHGAQVLCTYHPAYLLRNPAAKRDVWEDMKKLMAAMGRPVG